MKTTFRDYFALSDPKVYNFIPFYLDSAVLGYTESLGITRGARELSCLAADWYIDKAERPCIAYVNTVEGKITNVKFRAVDTKGFSVLRLPDDNLEIPPYNIDCLWPGMLGGETGLTLIVTEGEKDVCSLATAGYRYVISPPNGGKSDPGKFMAPFEEWLSSVSRVIICHDEDKTGYDMVHAAKEYFCDKMGKTVGVTRLPYGFKDISDILLAKGVDGVREIIGKVTFPDSGNLVYPASIGSEVLDVLNGNFDHGYGTGFGKFTDRHFWLTDCGGLIVVTGKPNSGKTDWCRCLMTHLVFHCHKGVCFCSFEEPDKAKHIASLMRIATACEKFDGFTADMLQFILDYMDRHVVNITLGTHSPTPDAIIRLCEEAIRRQPVHFLYIDPYLFIEPDRSVESETLQIKQVLTKFQSWGRVHHVWVVMVAHPRKLVKDAAGKMEEIDEYTISGSAHWANLADYLMSVKRVFVGGMKPGETPCSDTPSYTDVTMLKVRDQSLCHTGHMYFVRQSCGRYDERPNEDCCKREVTNGTLFPGDIRTKDLDEWIEVIF